MSVINIPWNDLAAVYPRAVDGLWIALRDVGIPLCDLTNEVRFCYFMAQMAHETGGFQWLKELGNEAYFTKLYEGRKDLGNRLPGDGAKYCGRGLIHVTGRANYVACAEYTGINCIAHPELLEQPVEACQATAWYWMTRTYKNLSMNEWCDQRDFRRITRMINGGLAGYKNRQAHLTKISALMGMRL